MVHGGEIVQQCASLLPGQAADMRYLIEITALALLVPVTQMIMLASRPVFRSPGPGPCNICRTVTEGTRRLSRPWAPLVAIGLVGGTDVATGVLALLLVLHTTGPTASGHLWVGLAFSVGFIALTLARSELFTENLLVPVSAVVVKQATMRSLLRLWSVTLVANLASGWLITALIMAGFPQLSHTAIDDGGVYVGYGIGWRSFGGMTRSCGCGT
jgi:hypothetical protein